VGRGVTARKLSKAGLPAECVAVVLDAVEDPGAPGPPGRGAVFVCRLSPESRVEALLSVYRDVSSTGWGGRPRFRLAIAPQRALEKSGPRVTRARSDQSAASSGSSIRLRPVTRVS